MFVLLRKWHLGCFLSTLSFLAIRSTKTSCFVIPFLCSGVFGAKAIVVLAEKLGRLAVQLVAGGSGVKTVKSDVCFC